MPLTHKQLQGQGAEAASRQEARAPIHCAGSAAGTASEDDGRHEGKTASSREEHGEARVLTHEGHMLVMSSLSGIASGKCNCLKDRRVGGQCIARQSWC